MAAVWIALAASAQGILAGKPYTHAWANFILMFYFSMLTILWIDDGERWLALVELALTTGAFIANILFARHAAELGLKLKKLSQVEKEERARHEGQ